MQSVYQRRTLTNLRSALNSSCRADEAQQSCSDDRGDDRRGLAARGALGWQEADSESARALLTAFVDGRLKLRSASDQPTRSAGAAAAARALPAAAATFASINPATGDGARLCTVRRRRREVDAAVRAAQRGTSALGGADRSRARRASCAARRSFCARAIDELAELETRDTGKPIQETRVVDVISGADCLEYFAGLAAVLARRASSTSARRHSATRGASRSAWSRASARGTIRCRSPAGSPRRRSPAATP